jgi:hypothetical protein
MDELRQRIEFHLFGATPLRELLELEEPPFARDRHPFRQLAYIERYVQSMGCKTVVIERHYIDRDYMEDHSVYYSRSFPGYRNWCQRAHFFSNDLDELQKEIRKLLESRSRSNAAVFRDRCREFSDANYLGFSIIKPLHGSPVGRTVLRCYNEDAGEFRRELRGTRSYQPHFMGMELSVRGLAFQQQDTGVSACATTALWSAMQKIRDLEDVAAATPAQITTVASQYSLPFGRTMPSEGLSIDQMCQAIRSLGLSPNLFRAERYDIARGLLFSAGMSGMAPILILETPTGTLSHAVTMAGLKLRKAHKPDMIGGVLDEQASDLVGAYVHDDRYGPYLSITLEGDRKNVSFVKMTIDLPQGQIDETWALSHILIPMHSKIRLSFQGLRDVGTLIVKALTAQAQATLAKGEKVPSICMDTRIVRSHRYVEELLLTDLSASETEGFYSSVSLARYIGLIRLDIGSSIRIDILVDTTDTLRNAHCSAVVLRGKSSAYGEQVAQFLVNRYGGVQARVT